MNEIQIIGIISGIIAGGTAGILLYTLRPATLRQGTRDLMAAEPVSGGSQRNNIRAGEVDELIKFSGFAKAEQEKDTIQRKLYRSGYYAPREHRLFLMFRAVSLIAWGTLLPIGMHALMAKATLDAIMLVLGISVGFIFPLAWLDRKVRLRREDLSYYLPLVIEQISIGVSSSLDIGPSIAQIIETASDRESHNPVTELFLHVEKLVRSGLGLEEALIDVGSASRLPEIKHAFMFLAQCSKHGGEVSKQLQELADAVMTQRQTFIEARITALPVKATGPLTLVFAGFFGLLFAGLFARLALAFVR